MILEERLSTRVDVLNVQLNTRIDELSEQLNARIDEVNEHLSTRIDELSERLDRYFAMESSDIGAAYITEEQLGRRLTRVEKRVNRLEAQR